MLQDVFVLILAGGSGERFWPLSRKESPKQLLSLFGDETLLGQTIARLDGFVPKENILLLTNEVQEAGVRKAAPDLPAENIVAEPAKRDTAPAIALATGWVTARSPNATMIVLPADHLIRDVESFQKDLELAVRAAREKSTIVTIGVKPTWPCPGYGYIECGQTLEGFPENVSQVISFREKPSPERAKEFLAEGNFRWNAGMFVWGVPIITQQFKKHTPQLARFIEELSDRDKFDQVLAEQFPKLEKISIDYAVMEKADSVAVVESAFDWDDIGSWTSVAKYLDQDDDNNATRARSTTLESADNIVYSSQKDKVVALLGVEDLIVIDTPDAILVAKKSEAEKIKKLVAELPDEVC